MCVSLHVNYPSFADSFRKIFKFQISLKSVQRGEPSCPIQADGRTDEQTGRHDEANNGFPNLRTSLRTWSIRQSVKLRMYIFLWRLTLHILLTVFVSDEMILAEDSECCWCLRMPDEESFLPSRVWTVLLHVCSIDDRLQDPKPGRMQYWMRDDILTAVNIQMANWMWHCVVR